jgi:carboxylate-amine ligase
MSVDLFRGSAGPILGVELEFQLVDVRSLALASVAGAVLADIPAWASQAGKPEFHDCSVEINTGVCRDVAEVESDLGPKLYAAKSAAALHGAFFWLGVAHTRSRIGGSKRWFPSRVTSSWPTTIAIRSAGR